MTNVVYVFNSIDAYKFGTGGKGTLRSNARLGVRLIACWPGNQIEEQLIMRYWESYRLASNDGHKELFQKAPAIDRWLLWMADNELAWDTYDEAITHAALPFARWSPDNVGTPNYPTRSSDGQLSWFESLPIDQRFQAHCGKAKAEVRSDDWYTPPEWAEKVRRVLGGIDCDPASTEEANRKSVHAHYFYDKGNSGLDLRNPWNGTIYLNPPYGRGEGAITGFIKRLREEVLSGHVTQAIVCVQTDSLHNANMQPLLDLATVRPLAYAIPRGRMDCIPPRSMNREEKSRPSKGMSFVYIGRAGNKDDRKHFFAIFRDVAHILVPPRRQPESAGSQ
jgi:hypothetical protein